MTTQTALSCVYCANGDIPDHGKHWFTSPSGQNTKGYPCSCPPVAPSAIDIDMPRVSPRSSDTFSACDGRETQPPNLLDRLTLYRDRARHCESPIERREWVEAAENLIDQLFDPRETCDCGMTFDNMTGLCLDCIERHEQLTAAREHAGAMALDIDTDCGF